MATTKPGKIYRRPKSRKYTRREYMEGVPNSRITIYDMGDLSNPHRFPVTLSLYPKEDTQITHNAMEASRIAANRYIVKVAGRTGFYLKYRVAPHVVLRENRLASGAGADRVSDGMRKSFGKNIGLAAHVKKNQKIISLSVPRNRYKAAREALRRAGMKIPAPYGISIDRGKELLKQ